MPYFFISPFGAEYTIKTGAGRDGISGSAGATVLTSPFIYMRPDPGALSIAFLYTTFGTDRNNVSVSFGLANAAKTGSI